MFINIRKIIGVLTITGIIYSCDVGGGADTGASVELTASADKTFITSDLIDVIDSNEDGICEPNIDETYIPAEETIDITFRLIPLINPARNQGGGQNQQAGGGAQQNINVYKPSPVRIEKVILKYRPKDDTSEPIPDNEYTVGITIHPEEEVTMPIPVIQNTIKEKFLQENKRGEYFVSVIIKAVEINYDNTLEAEVSFTLNIDIRISEDSDECM